MYVSWTFGSGVCVGDLLWGNGVCVARVNCLDEGRVLSWFDEETKVFAVVGRELLVKPDRDEDCFLSSCTGSGNIYSSTT